MADEDIFKENSLIYRKKVNAEEVKLTEDILALYETLQKYEKLSLETAMKIGELLCKQRLKTSYIKCWVEDNFSFSYKTAQRWMDLDKYKDKLISDKINTLNDAYAKN